MLRVSLDLLPYGDEAKAESLGTMEIGNIKSYGNVADYSVRLNGKDIAIVKDFVRSQGAWDLVREAIKTLPHELRRGLNPPSEINDLIEFIKRMKGEKGTE